MENRPAIRYTAAATVEGGREGHGRTSDSRLEVDFDVPSEMGGSGGPGTNPEQLLALGWAACFQSSMQRYAAGRELDLSGTRITSHIGIGTLESGGFGLVASLDLEAPGLSRPDAIYLMERAHETCPYSRATRGNVEVRLSIGGTTIDRLAA
jgi:osmotically inducible protein OsmC